LKENIKHSLLFIDFTYGLFNDAVSNWLRMLARLVDDDLVDDDLNRIWMEAVATYF
jgi:hypothetical protein